MLSVRHIGVWGRVAVCLVGLLCGCNRYLSQDLRVGRPSCTTHGLSGVDAELPVANTGMHDVSLELFHAALLYDGAEVLRVRLIDTVWIAPGWEGNVWLRCRMRVPDRAALYAVQRKLERGELQRMKVDLQMQIRIGRKTKKITRRTALSEFLDTFGVTTTDLLNEFK